MSQWLWGRRVENEARAGTPVQGLSAGNLRWSAATAWALMGGALPRMADNMRHAELPESKERTAGTLVPGSLAGLARSSVAMLSNTLPHGAKEMRGTWPSHNLTEVSRA